MQRVLIQCLLLCTRRMNIVISEQMNADIKVLGGNFKPAPSHNMGYQGNFLCKTVQRVLALSMSAIGNE